MTLKRKYPLNENVFDELNETSAYWIGFLYGDGYCRENRIRFTISQKDEEFLKQFLVFIESIRPIRRRTQTINKKQYHSVEIDFRSWRIHNQLKKYGIYKRKDARHRLHINLLQPKIRKYFVHGIFDADGEFTIDKRGYLFAEINGYMPLLKDIKNILVADGIISEKKKIVKNGNTIYRLRLCATDTKKLVNYFYLNIPKFFLKRKYDLAMSHAERLNEVGRRLSLKRQKFHKRLQDATVQI